MRCFKRKISLLIVLALMINSLFLVGCDDREELIIYNWGDYIAEDTIDRFKEAYPQYKVVYRTFETNETMYPNLSNSYDVIIPSEYMVCRLLKEERIQPLDWSKLPNVSENMNPLFDDLVYSQDREISDEMLDYSVPYLYSTVGIIYDADKIYIPENCTDPKVVWDPLFDKKNVNNIAMFDAMRETIGTALNYLGYSINTLDNDELKEARDLLIKQKDELNPTYGIDNIKDKMVSGELFATLGWSGDYEMIVNRLDELGIEDRNLRLVVPEGSNWSVDLMCIPTNAQNVEGAHDFINFMYEPEIAYNNCEYVGYSTPNVEAQKMLEPEKRNNIFYYPDEELFESLEVYYSSAEIEEKYTGIWGTVKASS